MGGGNLNPPSNQQSTHPPTPSPPDDNTTTKMAAKTPVCIVVLAAIVSTLYLISAMGLLSSIIAWLSLEFTADLPGALSFTVGVLALGAGLTAILMVGISRLRKCLGLLFLLLAIIVILAGVGLLTPFTINYIDTGDDAIGQICDDCEQLGMATIECVQLCKDECCFTDMSGPLSIVILAFTATALAASVIGLGVVVAHLYFARKQSDNVRKQL